MNDCENFKSLLIEILDKTSFINIILIYHDDQWGDDQRKSSSSNHLTL